MANYNSKLQTNNSGLQEILDAVNSLPKHEEVILQKKTVAPSAVEQEIVPSDGYTALSEVTVKPIPAEYVVPSGELEITENGSFDVKNYASAKVNVQSGDTLKTFLETRGVKYLFYYYDLSFPENFIPYDCTENITSMSSMFNSCSSLVNAPLFNTKSATSMSYMFYGCNMLKTVPLYDTKNVTNMSYMFYNCYYVDNIPLFDTSKVTDMNRMFSGCMYSLRAIPPFNTSNVTNMDSMFYNAKKITNIMFEDTSKVTNMENMFNSAGLLTDVVMSDMSNVTNAGAMFSQCGNLKNVVLGKISSALTSSSSWFSRCSKLEVVYFKDATGVPTLTNTNAFTNVPSTCKVVVPDALYDEWTNKTNWSAINVTWVKQSEYTEE